MRSTLSDRWRAKPSARRGRARRGRRRPAVARNWDLAAGMSLAATQRYLTPAFTLRATASILEATHGLLPKSPEYKSMLTRALCWSASICWAADGSDSIPGGTDGASGAGGFVWGTVFIDAAADRSPKAYQQDTTRVEIANTDKNRFALSDPSRFFGLRAPERSSSSNPIARPHPVEHPGPRVNLTQFGVGPTPEY